MYTMHIKYGLENDKEYKISDILKYDKFTIDDIIVTDIFSKSKKRIEYNKSVIPSCDKRPRILRKSINLNGRSILFTYETKEDLISFEDKFCDVDYIDIEIRYHL